MSIAKRTEISEKQVQTIFDVDGGREISEKTTTNETIVDGQRKMSYKDLKLFMHLINDVLFRNPHKQDRQFYKIPQNPKLFKTEKRQDFFIEKEPGTCLH